MSHLTRHLRKKNSKKMMIFSFFGVILMVIFIRFGLRGIIDGVMFLNSGVSKDKIVTKTTNNKNEIFLGSFRFDEPLNATNEAYLFVSGDVDQFDLLQIFINNSQVKEKIITNKSSFSERVGLLKEGNNKLFVVVKSKDSKHEKQSDTYIVEYIKEDATLEINSPKDKSTTSKSEIEINGITNKNASVTLNNRPLVVDLQGNFTTNFKLNNGENKLQFSATDIAGNLTVKEITIIYQKED